MTCPTASALNSDQIVQTGNKNEIARLVRKLLANSGQSERGMERRKEQRFPFFTLLAMTPVDTDLTILGDPILVMGKQISLSGLGFIHTVALPYKDFLVAAADDDLDDVQVLLRSKWCRFVGPGWYESGGQFQGVFTTAEKIEPIEDHKVDLPSP